MSFYEEKLSQLKADMYANEHQIETIIGVRKYIDSHYHQKLNLDKLSKTQFVSKYHLLRLFKRYYGMTPRQYLIDKRIEKSKEHLLQGNSVTEVCFAVGFESIGSFSSLFKTRTGKSPSKYQKEQLSRSNSNFES
jgi:AraC-like DNA-binding protein